jgi:hypothetical protein
MRSTYLLPALALLATTVVGFAVSMEERRKHWSYQPVRMPKAGETIDGFIDAKLAERGLKAEGPASPQSLLRRIHATLSGLPPTIDEQDRFLNQASSEGIAAAVTRRVDDLLASPHFGERWTQHWLDVVRFAETKGHEYDYEIQGAWRFRDYLIRAFNADLPFSQMIREQVAGDLLAEPRRDAQGENESRLGTIFWNLGESATSPVDLPNDEGDRIDNQADVLGKAFLGLTVGCARCHDHKFDPITQRDYHALFSVLASTPLDRAWMNEQVYQAAHAPLKALRSESEKLLPKIAEAPPVPTLTIHDGRVFADFSGGVPDGWQVAGAVETVTAADSLVRRVQPGLWSGLLARRLPARVRSPIFQIDSKYIDIVVSGVDSTILVSVNNIQVIRDPIYDELHRKIDRQGEWQVHRIRVGRWMGQPAYIELFNGKTDLLRTYATERQQFGLRAVVFANGTQTPEPATIAFPPLPDEPRLHEIAAETLALEQTLPWPEHYCSVADPVEGMDRALAKRGDAKKPGDVVPRGFLQVVAAASPSKGSGRREIAESLTSPENTLTARVFVNRIWHHLFGRGLVATPDDFGAMGDAPSHPELLDLLAHRFMHEHGWSLKKLIREIVLTRAWQRATAAGDAESVWLRSYPLRRLDAEALRDAILATSGRLDRKVGGHSVAVHLVGDFFGGGNDPGENGSIDSEGRRSLYIKVRRNFPNQFLTMFDKPAPSSSFGRRNLSNVPAQSLALLNDPFVVGQAEFWAKRSLAEPGTRSERVSRLYREALARTPTEAELSAANEFLGESDDLPAWSSYAQTFFNLKEFAYLP